VASLNSAPLIARASMRSRSGSNSARSPRQTFEMNAPTSCGDQDAMFSGSGCITTAIISKTVRVYGNSEYLSETIFRVFSVFFF